MEEILFDRLKRRYYEKGGLKELLIISIPLIISSSTTTLQHFIDRLFLTWYSSDAIASAMTAGLLQFTILSFFVGTASYTSTFVAQYYGAGQKEGIGKSVWQGIYLAILGTIFIYLTYPFVEKIFVMFNHPPTIVKYETQYYQVLCFGVFPAIASSSLSGYFSGQGKTIAILIANTMATIINIILDYLLIFGNFGFPRMGIKGAAIATNTSFFAIFFFYLFLMTRKRYRKRAPFFSQWRFDRELFKRFFKFGFASGIQFFIEMMGYSIFLLLIGKIGKEALTASTIAFNINNLSFMPMLGVGLGVSVLVGQFVGEGKPELGEKTTYNGLIISLSYITILCSIYLFFPSFFISLFKLEKSESYAVVKDYVIILLRFVACYSIFDMLNLTFSGTLKGAGDTRYISKIIICLSILVLILPITLSVTVFNRGLFSAWFFLTLYVSLLGIIFFLRFKGGKWKKMRVIDKLA
jgi:MATE family multidrug resistance protein